MITEAYGAPRVRPRRTALAAVRLAGRVDWVVLVSTFTLCLLGALSVYAATRNSLRLAGARDTAYLTRDAINIAVGATLALPFALIDYRSIRGYVTLIYGVVCFLLLAVLSPVGATINGAHAWFSLAGVQLEPSEFAKIGVILLLSALLAERRDNQHVPSSRDVLLALGITAVPMLLIMVEPALGIALVLGVIALAVLAVSGTQGRWLLGLTLGAVVVGVLAFSLHLLKPYQQERFTYFANSAGARTTTGYQIEQSKIAIGSGGLTGQGFLRGSQTNGRFIPEQQTDFVFTVGAEEGGLVGCTVLLAAIGALLWRGIRIAEHAPDLFGRCVAGGIVMWFAFQAFTNIGMTLGIMPVTGLPLPFVSYGGSAMFADLIAVALLLNIAARSRRLG